MYLQRLKAFWFVMGIACGLMVDGLLVFLLINGFSTREIAIIVPVFAVILVFWFFWFMKSRTKKPTGHLINSTERQPIDSSLLEP